MKKEYIDFDELIAQIMENESAGKNLTDEEYQSIINFLKDKLFDFLIFIYKCKNKNIRKSKEKLKEFLIQFSTELIKNFNHGKVEIEINILSSTLSLLNDSFQKYISNN